MVLSLAMKIVMMAIWPLVMAALTNVRQNEDIYAREFLLMSHNKLALKSVVMERSLAMKSAMTGIQ